MKEIIIYSLFFESNLKGRPAFADLLAEQVLYQARSASRRQACLAEAAPPGGHPLFPV